MHRIQFPGDIVYLPHNLDCRGRAYQCLPTSVTSATSSVAAFSSLTRFVRGDPEDIYDSAERPLEGSLKLRNAGGRRRFDLAMADRPSDVWTYVLHMAEDTIEGFEDNNEILQLLSRKIARKVVKQTVRFVLSVECVDADEHSVGYDPIIRRHVYRCSRAVRAADEGPQ